MPFHGESGMRYENNMKPQILTTWVRCRGLIMTVALAGLVLSAYAGCSRTDHEIPDSAPPEPPELYQPFTKAAAIRESQLERPPYRLTPGDVLEIIYQVRNKVTDTPYELKIEDVIKINFPYQVDFDQELTVQADGFIRCLLLGRVRASGRVTAGEGLTAGDLELALEHGYARYIKDPELTVIVEAGNVKITELKEAITTAPRGQSRLIPIKPDGTIDLPYIGEAMVAGLTVAQSKALLDKMYEDNDLPEVEVTVQTLHFATKKFYVMGEVPYPGMMETMAPTSLMQAIIRSGGPTIRADTRKILLVRRRFLPLPQAIIFDFASILDAKKPSSDGLVPNGSKFRYDIYLEDGDIVYIPPTDLARATDWIDQVFTKGVRPIFPVSGNVGMNFGYQIHNAESAIKSRTIGPPSFNTQIGP